MKNVRKRYDSIQVIRAIAMIIVFISHSGAFIANKYLWGAIGVTIFMVLSGFCLFISKDEAEDGLKTKKECLLGGGEYLVTQIKKFYPLYLVMILVSLPVKVDWSLSIGENISYLIKYGVPSGLMIQSYIPDTTYAMSFNNVAWYLSTITLFYFVGYEVIHICKNICTTKMKCIFMLCLIICFQIILACIVQKTTNYTAGSPNSIAYWLIYINPFFRLGDFCLGIITGICYKKQYFKVNYVTLVVSIAVLVVMIKYCWKLQGILGYAGFYTLGAVMFIYNMVGMERIISKYGKPLVWLGNISFEIYLLHRMILIYMQKMCDNGILNRYVGYVIAIILTIWIAETIHVCKKFALKKRG